MMGSITIPTTGDPNIYQSYTDSTLPDVDGRIYVGVRDADRTTGNSLLDTLYIDHIFIRTIPFYEIIGGVFTSSADNIAGNDIPVSGTVSNTYLKTQATDNDYESITEVQTGGNSGSNTYTYSGVTASGGPHDAWICDADDNAQAELTNPNSATEFTDGEYSNVAGSENTLAGPWTDPGNNDENLLKFRFSISDTPSTITQIELTYEAQYSTTSTGTMYVYNNVAATWDTVGATASFTAATDYTMTRTITTTITDYFSSGNLLWAVYCDSTGTVAVDYVQVVISYTTPIISSLEHKWTVSIPSSSTDTTVYLEAYHSTNSEGDDFRFYYSTTGSGSVSTWTQMITVTATSDPGTYQTFSDSTLDAFSGTLYIGVVDIDRTGGNSNLDTIYIDHMYICVSGTVNSKFGWSVADAGNVNADGSGKADIIIGAPGTANGNAIVWLDGDFEGSSSIFDTSQADFRYTGSTLATNNPGGNVYATADGKMNLSVTTIFSDDFENDVANSNPDSPPWTTLEDTATTNVAISNSVYHGGSQSVMFDDDDVTSHSTPTQIVDGCYINSATFTATTVGGAEWWARVNDQGGNDPAFSMELLSGTSIAALLTFLGTDIIYYDGAVNTILTGYTEDQWYKFRLAFDTTTDTYDIYIDEVLVKNDAPFYTAVASIDTLHFATERWITIPADDSGTPLAYVDDIRVFTYNTPGTYESSNKISAGYITAIKPYWNNTLPSNTKIWVNFSRDGGTTWNQSAITSGKLYRFPSETIGNTLKYRVKLYTSYVGDSPVFLDMKIYYWYCISPDITLTGQSPGDKFGWSVHSAGDINSDGYDDIIVGAPYNANGGTGAGAVYVFNGSAAMASTTSASNADYIKNGSAGSHFGWSVGKAGDLDDDGKNDVIAGAPDRDNGTTADAGWTQVLSILSVIVPVPEFSATLIAIFIPLGISFIVFRRRRKRNGERRETPV